jgi:voltage-gated potassium channel
MKIKKHKNLLIVLLILIVLIFTGTIGYSKLLKVSLLDGLYMTIITISSVGYKEVAPMTDLAKIFSIFIIFFGVGTVGYALTNLILVVVEGDLNSFWRIRKMENYIGKMFDHYIVCGAGETGEVIIDEFIKNKTQFVVIEKEQERYENYLQMGINIIHGDATDENVLNKAGILHAKGLISSLSRDVDNVFVVLTARTMNKNLYIISRAIDKHAPDKLKKAGANKTISANEIGGRRMATQMLRPAVVSFLEVITNVGEVELDLQDVIVGKKSIIIDKELKEIRIPDKFGLVVIAVKRKGELNMILNPKSDLIINEGDTMLVLGNDLQVDKLRHLADDSGFRNMQ